jgi:HSP20 family protein
MLTKYTKRTVPTLFESLFNDSDFLFPEFIGKSHMNKGFPSVNLKESDNSFEIEIAAPGLNKKDFNIEVDDGVLTISSESKEEKSEENINYSRKEFSFSSFSRSFNLPESVDADKIGAKYENGILMVDIPKKEEAKEKRRLIEIS